MKDRINNLQYAKLTTEEHTVVATRCGLWQYEEQWKDVPDSVSLKVGTRVMVLRNLYGETSKTDKVNKVDSTGQSVEHTIDGIVLRNADGSVGFVNEDSDNGELLQANGDTGVIESIEWFLVPSSQGRRRIDQGRNHG